MKIWKIIKENGFFLWVMSLCVALVLFFVLTRTINYNNDEGKIEQVHFTSSHSSFTIYYKDSEKKEEVECDECIYGQTDDKIYFINNDKDTVRVVPKIEVERVATLDEEKAK